MRKVAVDLGVTTQLYPERWGRRLESDTFVLGVLQRVLGRSGREGRRGGTYTDRFAECQVI